MFLPFLLYWSWRNVPLQPVFDSLRQLSIAQIIILICLNVGLLILFSIRWWLILRFYGYTIPLHKLSMYRTASFAISFLTPGPQFGGEPLQVHALNTRHQISEPAVIASVILDKTIELLVNFTFLGFAAALVLSSGVVTDLTLLRIGSASFFVILIPVFYLILIIQKVKPLTLLWKIIGHWFSNTEKFDQIVENLSRIEDQVQSFAISQPKYFLLIFGVSLLVWVGIVFEYWLSFYFLGLNLLIPELLFVMLAARLALLLPMPGGIGVLEASQVLALQFMGLNPSFGVSFMVLARGRDFMIAASGVIFALLLTRTPAHSDNWVNAKYR